MWKCLKKKRKQDQILSPDVNTEVTTPHIRILTGNLSTTQFTRSRMVAPSGYSGHHVFSSRWHLMRCPAIHPRKNRSSSSTAKTNVCSLDRAAAFHLIQEYLLFPTDISAYLETDWEFDNQSLKPGCRLVIFFCFFCCCDELQICGGC